MFTYETTIKLHQTDAAGVCFFGNYFHIAHDAYESFMASIGCSLRSIIEEGDDVVLIVHAEADYMKPTRSGDRISVRISLSKLGRTSYTLEHTLVGTDDLPVAVVKTVHVAVNKDSMRSVRLAEKLVAGLKSLEA